MLIPHPGIPQQPPPFLPIPWMLNRVQHDVSG